MAAGFAAFWVSQVVSPVVWSAEGDRLSAIDLPLPARDAGDGGVDVDAEVVEFELPVEVGESPPVPVVERLPPEGADGFVEVPPVPVNPRATDRSRSASGQFLVFGDTLSTRGSFAVFAEAVKADYLALLRQPDRWRYPVVIAIAPASESASGLPAVQTSFQQVLGSGFRFVVRVEASARFDREAFREALVRALVAEQVLRPYSTGSEFAGRGELLPPWLLTGIVEAVEFRRRGRPSAVFAAVLGGGRLLDLDEVLASDPGGFDSVSLAAYRASCGAVVLALLAQPDGADRFDQFLSALVGEARGLEFLLRKHFPAFRLTRNSLEKWWAVQVATLAQPSVFDTLNPAKTDEAITAELTIRYPVEVPSAAATADAGDGDGGGGGAGEAGGGGDAKKPSFFASLFRFGKGEEVGGEAGGEVAAAGEGAGAPVAEEADGAATTAVADQPEYRMEACPIRDYRKLLGRPDRAALVKPNQLGLTGLQQRAFPLLRPVIDGYLDVFARIAAGKTDGVDAALAGLEERRRVLLADARDAEDYLDWFEATQQPEKSGAFDAFFEASDDLRESRPERADPVSRYLDAVEKLVD